MNTEIFYFTGTGNSLYVARRLAELTGARLTAIASTIGREDVATDAKAVGIVFPCYLAHISGLPLIVEDFVRKLKVEAGAYLFAVCTYGAFGPVNYVPTFISLRKAASARGQCRFAEFSIKLPMNNLDYDHVPVPINRDHEKMFAYTEEKVKKMVRTIFRRRLNADYAWNGLVSTAFRPLFGVIGAHIMRLLAERAHASPGLAPDYRKLVNNSDRSIRVDDRCVGCGICAKVCPVGNIALAQGKPTWQHRCVMCLACDEWCPERAIRHWCKTEGKDYHHPNVTLRDMLEQARGQ